MKKRLASVLAVAMVLTGLATYIAPSANAAVACVAQGTATTGAIGYPEIVPGVVGVPARTVGYTLTASTSVCVETAPPGVTAGVGAGGTLVGNCGISSSTSGNANVGTTSGPITYQSAATILVIGAYGGRYVGVANAIPVPQIGANSCLNGTATSFLVTGVVAAP